MIIFFIISSLLSSSAFAECDSATVEKKLDELIFNKAIILQREDLKQIITVPSDGKSLSENEYFDRKELDQLLAHHLIKQGGTTPITPVRIFKAPSSENLALIHKDAQVDDLDEAFDILARKASESPGFVHEVDVAFSAKGMANNWIGVENHLLTVKKQVREKVFSVGSRGAIRFSGERSTRGVERLYAVIFPKGFVRKYGLDLRTQHISSYRKLVREYNKHNATQEKAFPIRVELSTQKSGQVHISNLEINIQGHGTNVMEFLRTQALGIVEFDFQGTITAYRFF